METVTCSCLTCKGIIGTYDNLWDKIGKTYYSPICWNPSAQDLGGLVPDGEVKAAAKAGVIENSFLQDLACKRCSQKLGIRVDSAPDSHVLTKDQLILRVGSMFIISDQTGEKGSLRVRRKFSLGATQPRLSTSKAATERSITPTGPVEASGLITPARPAPLPSDWKDSVSELLQFSEWAKQSIVIQGLDIGRISGAVSKLEREMKNISDFMSEVRIDMASRPGEKPWDSMKRTVANLEDEVGTLRAGLDGGSTSTNANKDRNAKLSGEDFDMLTDNITKINQKVSEIDGLKMELQFLKSRFKRFDDTSKAVRETMDLTTKTFSGQPSPLLHQSPFPTPSQSPALPPQRRAASVSLTPQPRRAYSALTADPDSGQSPNAGIVSRKRKYTDLGLDPLNTVFNDVSDYPAQANRRSAKHKPSRLSHVQLIEEVSNPNANSSMMDRSLAVDGANSDVNDEPARAYESAPEKGRLTTHGLSVIPRQREIKIRAASPDLSMPPPPLPHSRPLARSHIENAPKIAASIATREVAPVATPGSLNLRRSQRRAASEMPPSRYIDGVLLTRGGKVDQRSLRKKRTNVSWEAMNGEKGGKNDEGKHMQGGPYEGESDGVVQDRQGSLGRPKSASEGSREWRKGHGHSLRRKEGGRILPSIETGASTTGTEYEDSDVEIAVEVIVDAKKRAVLEARERLVRETLEREL